MGELPHCTSAMPRGLKKRPAQAFGDKAMTKTFLVEICFDLEQFDPERLTAEYVESVLRRRVGAPGVSIRVLREDDE